MKNYPTPLKDYLTYLRLERDKQEFERYLSVCKKDKKKYTSLVLMFALSMTAILFIAEHSIVPYTTLITIKNILNTFSQLTYIGLSLFSVIFLIKHQIQFRKINGISNIIFPIALGFSLTIYLAKSLLNLLLSM